MHNSFTILVVDDEANIVDLLTRAAQSAFPQAVFVHASSFPEAVAYLNDLSGRGPRLILLDIDLQIGPSGLEFLSLVRQHPQGHLLPIIMLSASRNQVDLLEAYRRGATAYTQKPFSFQAWKTYVDRLRNYWYETATIPSPWFQKEVEK